MNQKTFQDYYPDELSYCYGCGRLNEQGLKLKSYWDGEETVAVFNPRPYHIAIPGYVYGGLIASIIDCTPLGVPLEVRGKIKEIKDRKVVVSATVSAGGEICARGEVVAVKMPEQMMPKPKTT
jgi:hypothetical protein